MNWYWKIYWITRLDALQGLFLFLAILTGIGIVLFTIFYFVNQSDLYGDEENPCEPFKKYVKWAAIPVFFISVVGASLVPTKDEAILIMAGGAIGEFASKDTSLNKIPSQTTTILSKLLQEQIEKIERAEKEAKK